jgi:anti-sigma factor RsiW
MLLCRDELSLAEQLRLDRHTAVCATCEMLEAIYAENRARLRAMAQMRPPEELKAAVIAAADTSRPILGGMALFLPFCIIPVTFILIALAIAYGPLAWAGIGGGLFAYAALTTWYVQRREAAAEMPKDREDSSSFRGALAAIVRDTVGTLLGFLLLLLALSLVFLLVNGGIGLR